MNGEQTETRGLGGWASPGRWTQVIAVSHVCVAVLQHRAAYAEMGRRGVVDSVPDHGPRAEAFWFGGNATQNFWRSAENFMVPGSARWAVSQAAPMRRVDIRGDLNLAPSGYGWASGGYIADSRITGAEGQYFQQQWFTRNSTIGSNTNAV